MHGKAPTDAYRPLVSLLGHEGGSPAADAGVDGRSDHLDLALARRLCDASPLGIFLADGSGNCLYSNAACQQITGLTLDQTIGKPWDDLVHPEDRARITAQWAEAILHQRAFQSEARIGRVDGSVVWARLNAATVRGGLAQNTYLLMIEDVTDRKAAEAVLRDAEEALFAEKERAQVMLASIGDAVLASDLAGDITFLNPEAERLTGWSSDAAMGRPLTEVFRILDGATLTAARNPTRQAIEEGRTVELQLGCLLVRRDGDTIPIEDSAAPIRNRNGDVTGAVIVFHDAAQSKVTTERNAHLARHDALTGLANTALLTERLSQAIALALRHRGRLALLFIDLDRFKGVNDTHGHSAGDTLLKAVADRLRSCVRAIDTVCRRGGDEFVILLAEIECRQDAGHVAEKILAALCEPYAIDGTAVRISASIGISVYPENGDEATTLLQSADTAMYKAKESRQPAYSFAGSERQPLSAAWWSRIQKSVQRAHRQIGQNSPSSGVSAR
ncbi:MAG: diguanylate cyclase [Gammaproteobacteria bacterium]|nr:diguanylate cyclase [Gammaproteobacteria bacterium]